jgi:hypothetical protein
MMGDYLPVDEMHSKTGIVFYHAKLHSNTADFSGQRTAPAPTLNQW